jgi:hypothetical protein
VFFSKPALAVTSDKEKGRYQISACAVRPKGIKVHRVYYVLDKAPGKVAASRAETLRFNE